MASQQKTYEKKFSITKFLATIAALGGTEGLEAMWKRSELLTNGNRAPIPTRTYNQKQKRKYARQTGVFA